MYTLESLIEFFKQLSDLELVAMRHEAIQVGDVETKRMIDKELKRRVEK